MSETDEESTLKKIAGFFVKLDDEPEVPETAEAPVHREGTSDRVLPVPQPVVAAAEMATVLTSDFKTLYAKTGVTGDQNTESILNAFEGMKSLESGSLQTAMEAMIGALRADSASIVDTLSRRLGILTVALQQQKDRVSSERQQRVSALASFQSKTEQEISVLQKKIVDLTSEMALRNEATQKEDARDQGAIAGFEQRVMQEKARVQDLKGFLEKSVTPPADNGNR